MDLNKQLLWWMGGIFGSSTLLVIGVVAHDRQIDKCIVDHLFDFHLDSDHVKEEAAKDKFNKECEKRSEKEAAARRQAWADEVRSWYNDNDRSHNERGTLCPPDRDDNRDR